MPPRMNGVAVKLHRVFVPMSRARARQWGLALTAVPLLAVTPSGCATARNYLDPAGPIVIGRSMPAPAPSEQLRVVTFNVKFGVRIERAVQLFRQAPTLAGADIVVLQEMDGPGTEQVAKALGMNHLYVPSAIHPATKRDFGVAVLTRWPIEDARKILLPHRHRFRKLQRAAAAATVQTPLGAVRVYALHLETQLGASDGDRRHQVDAILEDVSTWAGIAVIAGDFNDRDAAAHAARAGFTWPTARVHDDAVLMDVDHILVRGLCVPAPADAGKTRDDLGVSDHRPVWAVMRRCEHASHVLV